MSGCGAVAGGARNALPPLVHVSAPIVEQQAGHERDGRHRHPHAQRARRGAVLQHLERHEQQHHQQRPHAPDEPQRLVGPDEHEPQIEPEEDQRHRGPLPGAPGAVAEQQQERQRREPAGERAGRHLERRRYADHDRPHVRARRGDDEGQPALADAGHEPAAVAAVGAAQRRRQLTAVQERPQQPGREHEQGGAGVPGGGPPAAARHPYRQHGDGQHDADAPHEHRGAAEDAQPDRLAPLGLVARHLLAEDQRRNGEREEQGLRHHHRREDENGNGDRAQQRGKHRHARRQHEHVHRIAAGGPGDDAEDQHVEQLEQHDVGRERRPDLPEERQQQRIPGRVVYGRGRAREVQEVVALPGGERLGENRVEPIVVEAAHGQVAQRHHAHDQRDDRHRGLGGNDDAIGITHAAAYRWQVTRWSLTMPTACMKA